MSVHAATASIQLPGRPLIPNFGLLVGRYSLNEDLTTVLRIRRDEQTGARLHVELFLDYVKNYLVSETGLHERLRALPNLPDIIHIRFIRLTKPGTEDRPYRQMFFVCYKSSNEVSFPLNAELLLSNSYRFYKVSKQDSVTAPLGCIEEACRYSFIRPVVLFNMDAECTLQIQAKCQP